MNSIVYIIDNTNVVYCDNKLCQKLYSILYQNSAGLSETGLRLSKQASYPAISLHNMKNMYCFQKMNFIKILW